LLTGEISRISRENSNGLAKDFNLPDGGRLHPRPARGRGPGRRWRQWWLQRLGWRQRGRWLQRRLGRQQAGADYWTAADLLQKVLSRQPDNPDVLNLMGFSERKLGYSSTALYYYKKALNLQPNHIGANEYLGELYLELKQPDLAQQRLVMLQQTCGNCKEYTELKEKIEKYKASPS
jgi:tetratricopeptide (TPR) repeat protein